MRDESLYLSNETNANRILKAAGGIGKETALAFAEAGARGVVFADVNHEGIKAAAEESSKYARHAEYRALAIKVDLTDAQSVQDLVETTVKEFGRIDYAVNSAGVSNMRARDKPPMIHNPPE
jgi:NAD(P)-dependent dehydrogenase (short-subunit alcohol dehydrogenase family)